MAATEAMIRRKIEVTKYEDTNEVINRLKDDDDVIWIVQGSLGRVPVLAATEEDAINGYIARYGHKAEEETPELE